MWSSFVLVAPLAARWPYVVPRPPQSATIGVRTCLRALRTHSAQQAPLWGSLVASVEYCVRVRQCWGFVSLFLLTQSSLMCMSKASLPIALND